MKKVLFFVLVLCLFATSVFAEYVSGYYRKNGTYVKGYNRSDRNATVRDNYSYKGNTNPYTGKKGTNYYRNDSSSEYYDSSYDKKYNYYND